MAKAEAGRVGQQPKHRAKTPKDSPAARTRERGLLGIARAQITRHGLLSKLSLKERRRALAQWLRGIQP